MPVAVIILLILAAIFGFYQGRRSDKAMPGLLHEWAKIHQVIVLRRLSRFMPWKIRSGLRYSKGDLVMCLEVMDETSHRIRRVWLLVRNHLLHDVSLGDIELIDWDD